MENSKSSYVKIINEICAEEGIKLSSYSYDWAFCLRKDQKRAFILGYQFGLNPSSVQQVCNDKNIASEVLKEEDIPSVYHACFMAPSMLQYTGGKGSWKALLAELEKGTLVCKDNYGTGGNLVFKVRTQAELEQAASDIYKSSEAMAVCRYEDIQSEYRLVVLDGEIRLAFSKIRPSLPTGRELRILDFGCGKSYLTFAIYYYLKVLKGYPVRITGLDLKEDVIRHCNELAVKYGYDKLEFLCGDIAYYDGCSQVDMVVTLHACDTATDYALAKAVGWGAKVILSVPCCQHELNKQMKNDLLSPVLHYGILKERMAALMTDGLRAQILEANGYRTQILEFIDMAHTPKNLLIRAVYNGHCADNKAQIDELLAAFDVNPTLYRLLCKKDNTISE